MKITRHQRGKLHRRLLPFYMKPIFLIAFIVISLVGHIVWATAVAMSKKADLSWHSSIGLALGIVLGYIQGRWVSRMWDRDYLRVLNREITFWEAKGAVGTTIYVILALGIPIAVGVSLDRSNELLVGLQSYIFGFVGGMNFALYLWVRQLPR